MPEGIFYSEEVHERVALYITQHGGRVQVERVDPGYVFHKVVFEYQGYRLIGGGPHTPIYVYTLPHSGRLLVQTIRGISFVPGHPDDYWTVFYIYTEDDDGKRKATAQIG